MSGIISIILIITGVILYVVGKKKHKNNTFKLIGALMILAGLVVAAPDFVKGFKEGFTNAAK